jgi:Tfp pilus assembly protein PilV
MNIKFNSGVSIIEVVIAAAIIGISFVGIISAFSIYISVSAKNAREAEAAMLLEETNEVLQIFRDESWNTYISPLNPGTRYYLYWDGVGYSATTTKIVNSNGLERTFTLSRIYRDGSDDIVSGGSEDENSRKASILVSWVYTNSTSTLSAQTLIHNVYDN